MATVFTSEYSARCPRCNKWVVPGDLVFSTKLPRKKETYTHATDTLCAAASGDIENAPPPVDDAERWRRLEKAGHIFELHPWKFAHTMPQHPHWYTTRKAWKPTEQEDFDTVVTEIRVMGELRPWFSYENYYLDINEYKYWTMDDVRSPLAACDLINRAIRVDDYTELAWDNVDYDEVHALLTASVPRTAARQDILDVGGLWPAAASFARTYTATGPSAHFTDFTESSSRKRVRTSLDKFVPMSPNRFDVIVCGAASSLQPIELNRMYYLLRRGGCIVNIFDRERKRLPGVGKWKNHLFVGHVEHVDNSVVVTWPDTKAGRTSGHEESRVSPHRAGWPR